MSSPAVVGRSARPEPPGPSVALIVGVVAFVVITAWAVIGLGPNFARILANLHKAPKIIGEFWPPDLAFAPRTFNGIVETFQMAVLATAIGSLIALPVAFLASRISAPNGVAMWLDRSVLSVVRSVPDILYAIIFVSVMSIGPLPGILALILFNIGVIAKLLSETIDGVDPGPIEAAHASGANHTQVVWTAVMPQVLPNYVAYALYTFELNIRASAVVGFVGAGGIGLVLDTQRKFFNYDNVAMIVLELFVMVVIIEFISERLRRRLA
ncbi:MAG TPA: phosphonate ABC transporter, permease protein PhnE [Candidatus Limnocylindria bacterium]|nr:phosphonate ABC transporter, permease protein PhnE [Candidatus Limnocylindria bacterium]